MLSNTISAQLSGELSSAVSQAGPNVPSAPVFSAATPGTYPLVEGGDLTIALSGAGNIYYRTDGLPATTSDTLYGGDFDLTKDGSDTQSVTITAICEVGGQISAQLSGTFVLERQLSPPDFADIAAFSDTETISLEGTITYDAPANTVLVIEYYDPNGHMVLQPTLDGSGTFDLSGQNGTHSAGEPVETDVSFEIFFTLMPPSAPPLDSEASHFTGGTLQEV